MTQTPKSVLDSCSIPPEAGEENGDAEDGAEDEALADGEDGVEDEAVPDDSNGAGDDGEPEGN